MNDDSCKTEHEKYTDSILSTIKDGYLIPHHITCPECEEHLYTDRSVLEEQVKELTEALMMEDFPERDWIVVDSSMGGTWECRRCKERAQIPVPLKLDTFINMSRAFALSHVLCEEVKDESNKQKP